MGIYDRQKDVLNIDSMPVVTVCGCGGAGYWVAKLLAMSGVDKMYLFDPDVIDETNLNRLDLPIGSIGINKAAAVKKVINHLRPACTVYTMPFNFKESMYSHSNYIVDCTDNMKSQLEIQETADKYGATYVKAGYNGTHISIHNRVGEWGESPDGYTITPSWVVPSVIVASLTVAKILKSYTKELSLDISKIFNFNF